MKKIEIKLGVKHKESLLVGLAVVIALVFGELIELGYTSVLGENFKLVSVFAKLIILIAIFFYVSKGK